MVNINLAFTKAGALDEDQRMVWGWASVSAIKSALILDTQNDVIENFDLMKMATDFMIDVRTSKRMHKGDAVGLVVHSLPLTDELAKSLGVTSDQEGWIVGVKIYDDETWKMVKSGELTAFSIGGRAERVPLDGD